MVSIKDIAKECNVSAMTVSRALNNSKEISEETRKRILEVCEKRGYKANSAARSLILKKTNMIGLVIPDITNQYYAHVSKGVSDYLDKNGYGMILCNSDRIKENEKKYLNFLSQKRVDGIILIPVQLEIKAYEDILNTLPMVLVDNYIEGLNISYIGNDNYAGAKQIITHMVMQGYKRIGVILGDEKSSASNERLKAYLDVMKEHNIEIQDNWLQNSRATFEDGFRIAKYLLEQKVDSIFAINDTVAMGVFKCCHNEGIKIPEDIGIAGYDDVDQASMMPIPLTTVHQKKFTLGSSAAKVLLDEINNTNTEKQKIILKPELIIRKSCRE